MNKKNLGLEQTCMGIEQLAIGLNFYKNNPRKKFPLQHLIGILEEAHKGIEASESLGLDINKNYSNYRKKIHDEFGIEINFQKRIPKNLKKFESKIPILAKIYLKKYSFQYSDFVVNKYFKLLQNAEELEHSLYTIVYLGIAALLKTKVEIVYEKMHGEKERKTYRLIPCGFISSTNYLQFIALDTQDYIVKYFVLSCIKEIKTDLFEFQKDTDRGQYKFDFQKFKKARNSKIQRKMISYKIKIKTNKLKHFVNKFYPEYIKLKETEEYTTIEFNSDKPKLVYRAVFEYGDSIEILSPKESIEEYKKILENTLKLY